MEFRKITAVEAASLVENGDTIGLSGFTPAGVAKCIPAAIAEKADTRHRRGVGVAIALLKCPVELGSGPGVR